MYNIACTGSCSSPRHAHQEMLAGLHLLPDQVSVLSCSTFVSEVFHIAKAVSNEAGALPGLCGDGCPRHRGVLGVAGTHCCHPPPPAGMLAFRDHKVVLLYLWQINRWPTLEVPEAVSQPSAAKGKLS